MAMRDRQNDAARRRTRGLTALALTLGLSGCGFFVPDRVHDDWRGGAEPVAATERIAGPDSIFGPEDQIIGLAFSGGGSRSAVFAAAALEELARLGLARQATHLSGVSGGAFAASYVATHPIPDCAGQDGACAAYFAGFQAAMRRDHFWSMQRRQLTAPTRLTSPTRRAVSLAEALDAGFLGGATFGDLPASPVLLINAARYDDARRFVFSQAALPEAASQDPRLSDEPLLGAPALRAASFSRPGCPRAAPAEMPLSFAVAASAAYPPVLGPVTLEVDAHCAGGGAEYWHLGDGGIIENLGLETLQEIVIRAAENGRRLRRVLLIAIDAEKRHDPARMLQQPDVRLWTSNPGIVVDTAKARGEALHAMAWRARAPALERRLGAPIEVIHVRYTDARLVDWPATCAAEAARGGAIADHLAAIPTGLSISDCDADLVAAAARALVTPAIEHALFAQTD